MIAVIDTLRAGGHPVSRVVCENVPGLLHHRGGCRKDGTAADTCPGCYWLHRILPAFRQRFAYVEYRTLDAADYGVPQRRRRVFLAAGPAPFDWPGATHGAGGGGVQPWRTLREALAIVGWRFVRQETTGSTARPVDGPSPTLGTSGMIYLHVEHPGRRGVADPLRSPLAGSRPDLLERPSPIVLAREAKGMSIGADAAKRHTVVQGASDAVFLATGVRRLTYAECAAIQSFRADYPWRGNATAIYRQIGNAVPPPLAAALGRAVVRG